MSVIDRIRDERGITAIVALLIMVVALLLATVVTSAAIDVSQSSRRDTAEKRAFEAAQAGLQQTLYRMNMLINTQNTPPSGLLNQCMGPVVGGEGIIAPSLNANSVCSSYTQSLGNNAYYTSWTSIAYVNTAVNLSCAGTSIPPQQFLGERCITSQGIVCPASYTGGINGLPCPGGVMHRVEERVSANLGQDQFLFAGLTGQNGVSILGSPTINGTVATNGELWLNTNSTVTNPEQAGGPPWTPPRVDSPQGQVGTCKGPQTTWPSTCVQNAGKFSLPNVQFPFVGCATSGPCYDTTNPYTSPDGNSDLANAFRACGQPGVPPASACTHDFFTGCSTTPQTGTPVYPNSCGWDPTTRTLILNSPQETWTMVGGSYDLCTLSIKSGKATLATSAATAIYIDSPINPSPNGLACPSGTGYFSMASGGQLANPSQNSLKLQVDIYGTSRRSSLITATYYNNNDCLVGQQTQNNVDCVQLSQGSAFYGTLDAPNSDIMVGNGGNNTVGTTGSVEGRTVTYANNSAFQSDSNDTSIKTYALGVYYRSLWHDCGVQPAVITDPMAGC